MRNATEKRVLVTGGAGFLGSHLCERLLGLGHDVLCVDNFYTGSRRNVAELLDHPSFELLRHDVTFPLYVEVDEIYNLACPASPIHYQHDPVQTTKTSVHGAINMLGLAKRVKAKIFQASTSEVYGDPEVHPQPESYWGRVNPIGVRSCYDEGKRCAETLFFDYHRQHRLQIKVARIFNTYGPHMHANDGRVVSNFIVQALRNRPLTIYGDGSQTRSFCYVTDLIDAFVALMDTPDDFTGPVNLGNATEFTILELAELVIELTNSRSIIERRPLPADDPKQRKPESKPRRCDAGVARNDGSEGRVTPNDPLFRWRVAQPQSARRAQCAGHPRRRHLARRGPRFARREQPAEERPSERRAHELGDDEGGHAARVDAGEAIRERASGRHRGVRERRGRREPVSGGDVQPDCGGDAVGSPARHAENRADQAEGRNRFGEPLRRARPRVY